MQLIEILIIAVSLALDALTVSVVAGIRTKKTNLFKALKISMLFGGFQFAMPLLGWMLGVSIYSIIYQIDHWIAFVLLSLIGLKMIKGAFQRDRTKINIFDNKVLLLLAIATSIDALAVGITFSFIKIPLLLSSICIGITTFILCFIGFLFGKKLGAFSESKIEILGGIALIVLAGKILIEHL